MPHGLHNLEVTQEKVLPRKFSSRSQIKIGGYKGQTQEDSQGKVRSFDKRVRSSLDTTMLGANMPKLIDHQNPYTDEIVNDISVPVIKKKILVDHEL